MGLRMGLMSKSVVVAATFAAASAIVLATSGSVGADVGMQRKAGATPRRLMYPYSRG